MHRKLFSSLRVLAAASLITLISACGSTLNSGKLETDLQKWLEQEEGLEAKSVSCPASIKIEVDETVECEAETEDGTQLITVTLDSEEGDVTPSFADNSNAAHTEDSSNSNAEAADRDSNEPVIDADLAESTIKKQFAEQTGIRVRSVDCPNNVLVEVNRTFNCTVTATNQKTIEAIVTQTNKEGAFSWNATNGLISYDKVETLIKDGIQDQENLAVTPRCGTSQTRYIIAYTDDTFSCTAKDPKGRRIPVNVSVQSDDGKVRVKWKLSGLRSEKGILVPKTYV